MISSICRRAVGGLVASGVAGSVITGLDMVESTSGSDAPGDLDGVGAVALGLSSANKASRSVSESANAVPQPKSRAVVSAHCGQNRRMKVSVAGKSAAFLMCLEGLHAVSVKLGLSSSILTDISKLAL